MLSSVSTCEVPVKEIERNALERFLLSVDIADYEQLLEDHRASSSPHKKTKKFDSTWQPRKDELHQLRAQVKEMQAMVTFLKARNTHSEVLEAHGWLSEGHRRWKATALKERKLHRLAKLENAQLKEKVNMYRKMIAALQIVLDAAHIERSEQFVADAIAARALRSELRIAPQLGIHRPALFSMLENAIQARCSVIESILRESRASTSVTDVDHAQIANENAATVMQFKRAHILQYSADKVSNAFWDLIKQGIIPDERSAPVTVKHNDVVQAEGYFTQPLDHGGSVDLYSHCLMKRVATSDGFLMLIESTTEWSARLPNAEHWRYQLCGSGWAAVCPVVCSNSGASQVRTTMRLRACQPEGSGAPKLPLHMSNDIVACFRRMMRTRYQIIDNFLLDASRAVDTCEFLHGDSN